MRVRPFFFHHQLGYRSNPFGALTPEEWTAVAFIPPMVQQILDNGCAYLQLLGGKGCGKTTTLLKLAAYYRGQGRRVVYEYIAEGQTHFAAELADASVFILDEAQRLNKRERRRWLREQADTAVPLTIFSSHENLAPLFKQRPLQSIQLDALISLTHYQAWIERRLAYFARPGVPQVALSAEAIRYLYHTFGTDMREAEYFLYDVFQQEWPAGEIGGGELGS
jgi:hypothetical protein